MLYKCLAKTKKPPNHSSLVVMDMDETCPFHWFRDGSLSLSGQCEQHVTVPSLYITFCLLTAIVIHVSRGG